MIVVDTNVISYFFIKGDFTDLAEKAFQKDPQWAAPLLWSSEFRNVLALCMRKEIVDFDTAIQIMTKAESLMRGNEYSITSNSILSLVSQSNCSAYDCEFVALARELNVPLVTMDKDVLKSFKERAVSLERFLDIS